MDKDFQQLAKTFALCTAYAANSGGIATLTGTPPNIILKGQADILYDEYNVPSEITFANWLIVGVPTSVFVFLACWVWLQIYAMGKKCLCCIEDKENYSVVRKHLQHEYRKLGRWTYAEKVVLANFITMALLWILRNPVFVPGWGNLFPDRFISDSTAAILMSVTLFFLPSEPLKLTIRPVVKRTPGDAKPKKEYTPLLTWKYTREKMAWGVLILMGGGFAVADGCAKSGLSAWMSDQLTVLGRFPFWLTSACLAYITAAISNVTSNAATATLLLPIVGGLAIKLSVHPLYFMIPCAIAASFAFMLPVGTPPNAIVFSTGYLTVRDMLKCGTVINFVSVLITCLCLNTFVMPAFDLYSMPIGFASNASLATSQVTPAGFVAMTTGMTTGYVLNGVAGAELYNVTGSE